MIAARRIGAALMSLLVAAGRASAADREAERATLAARLDSALATHAATVREARGARALAECGDRGARAAASRLDGDALDRAAACGVLAEAAPTLDAAMAARCIGEPFVDHAPLARLAHRVNAEGLAGDVARLMAARVDADPGNGDMKRIFVASRIGLLDDPSVPGTLLDLVQRQPTALGELFRSLWAADRSNALAMIESAASSGDEARVTALVASLSLVPLAVSDDEAQRLVSLLEPRFPERRLVPGSSLDGTEARVDNLAPELRLMHALGARALPALRRLARAASAHARRNAVLLLGEMPETPGSPALRAALEDGDASVRDVAIGALQRSEGCDASDAVRPLLVDDDEVVRRRAALFFAACPGTAAREELEEAAKTTVPDDLAFYERVQRTPDVASALDALDRHELLDVPRAVPLPSSAAPIAAATGSDDAPRACCATAEGAVAALLDGPSERRLEALAIALRDLAPARDATLLVDTLAFMAQDEDAALADSARSALAALQSP